MLWCWLTGVFGIATKYGEALLAVKYRTRGKSGAIVGGPMYTIERGLGWKWLAVIFAAFTVLATFGAGCTVQSLSLIHIWCSGRCGPRRWSTRSRCRSTGSTLSLIHI